MEIISKRIQERFKYKHVTYHVGEEVACDAHHRLAREESCNWSGTFV